MSLHELCRFCGEAVKAARAENTVTSLKTADAMSTLMDIIIEEYDLMKRSNALGLKEFRFKRRMYVQVQFTTQHRVLYAGSVAAGCFERRAKTMFQRFVPDTPTPTPSPPKRVTTSKFKYKPRSGCWLCPATDHYANDPKFHTKLKKGESGAVPEDVKEKILIRLNNSSLSSDEKEVERKEMLAYWEKRASI